MKIYAYECGICGDKIFSRARHDYRSCSCKSIAVDGGFDYNKITYSIHGKLPKRIKNNKR